MPETLSSTPELPTPGLPEVQKILRQLQMNLQLAEAPFRMGEEQLKPLQDAIQRANTPENTVAIQRVLKILGAIRGTPFTDVQDVLRMNAFTLTTQEDIKRVADILNGFLPSVAAVAAPSAVAATPSERLTKLETERKTVRLQLADLKRQVETNANNEILEKTMKSLALSLRQFDAALDPTISTTDQIKIEQLRNEIKEEMRRMINITPTGARLSEAVERLTATELRHIALGQLAAANSLPQYPPIDITQQALQDAQRISTGIEGFMNNAVRGAAERFGMRMSNDSMREVMNAIEEAIADFLAALKSPDRGMGKVFGKMAEGRAWPLAKAMHWKIALRRHAQDERRQAAPRTSQLAPATQPEAPIRLPDGTQKRWEESYDRWADAMRNGAKIGMPTIKDMILPAKQQEYNEKVEKARKVQAATAPSTAPNNPNRIGGVEFSAGILALDTTTQRVVEYDAGKKMHITGNQIRMNPPDPSHVYELQRSDGTVPDIRKLRAPESGNDPRDVRVCINEGGTEHWVKIRDIEAAVVADANATTRKTKIRILDNNTPQLF